MKLAKVLLPFALLGSVLVTAVRAADVFEGRVAMAITASAAEKDGPQQMTYAVKGQKMRMDIILSEPPADQPADKKKKKKKHFIPEKPPAIIYDWNKKEMIFLMENDGEKTFMRRPIPTGTAAKAAKHEEKVSEPVATGKTEEILGYVAKEYLVPGEKGESTTLWLAKGLGNFIFPSAASANPMGGGAAAPSPGWEKFVRDGGSFPLRFVTHGADGKEKMKMEVTKIEKTELPESLFSTDGYTEFQIPDFSGGLPGGLPGGLNPFKD